MGRIRRPDTGSGVARHLTGRFLVAACAALAVLLAGGAPGRAQVMENPTALPPPSNPSYESQALKLRAEDIAAVQHWRDSLEGLDQLIRARESGVPLNDDRDLYGWQGQMEMKLLQAEAALSRLEQGVRQDFNGQLPAWWPPDQT